MRSYLRQFLSDPKVIDIPAVARFLLLNFLILPFRPRKTSAAYAKIWTDQGSPLIVYSQHLQAGLEAELNRRRPGVYKVRLAMRYGQPDVRTALEAFENDGVGRILVLPLYPQYATSSYGSALADLYQAAAERWNTPPLEVLPPFFDEPGYITVLAGSLLAALGQKKIDHFLFSFHGLPERHIQKSGGAQHCLQSLDCCERPGNQQLLYCYRAQCYQNARLTAAAMGLAEGSWSVSFQSRLGRTPWVRPFTDERLRELAASGLRIATAAPSFTADCLETLEELAMAGKDDFLAGGGKEFTYLPCLNADPAWVAYLADRTTARTARS